MKDSETVCAPFGCQPPDHAIAANEKYVVQVVNTALLVYDAKKGKAKGKPVDLGKFFKVPAPAPKGCDPDDENLPFLSDPRAFYDPSTQRFVVAVLQVEGAPGFGIAPDCDFVSRYWVAVSKNDNPSGSWYVYGFDTSSVVAPGGAADYTQLGLRRRGDLHRRQRVRLDHRRLQRRLDPRNPEGDGRGRRGDSLARRFQRLHGRTTEPTNACSTPSSRSSRSATARAGRRASS